MQPEWTILIATIGRRNARFLRLLGQLGPQVEAVFPQVAVLALWNNGERPLAQVRQDLVDGATGRYVSFVDDDDEVPDYFVSRVLPLLDGVDYIGWKMQHYQDGHPSPKPTYHSLRYDGWSEDGNGWYRDVSHLNPVRRELSAPYHSRGPGFPEDTDWAEKMHGRLRTEHFIEDVVMYHYRSSLGDSTWRGFASEAGQHQRPEFAAPWFSYHPASSP